MVTVLADSCTETKSTPSVAKPVQAEFGGRWRKAMIGVCGSACLYNVSVSIAADDNYDLL